jgi:hypothetical protein
LHLYSKLFADLSALIKAINPLLGKPFAYINRYHFQLNSHLHTMKKTLLTLLFICGSIVSAQQPQYYEQVRVPKELQLGLAFIPGVGAQGGYIFPIGDIMTVETIAQVNLTPKTDTKAAVLDLSAGVGAGFRFMQLINQASSSDKADFDLDAGFRVGPKFFVKLGDDATATTKLNAEDKADVELFIDPFLRVAKNLRNGSRAYAEVGFYTKPALRLGVITPIK